VGAGLACLLAALAILTVRRRRVETAIMAAD
jgi:hypothetical protein